MLKVMIIDDYQGTALTLQKRFEIMGHQATFICEAKAALKACNDENSDSYDYFIVDLYLNGVNGIDIYEALKQSNRAEKVIFISGCDDKSEIFQEALATGRPVVMKKFDAKALVRSLETNQAASWADSVLASKGVCRQS